MSFRKELGEDGKVHEYHFLYPVETRNFVELVVDSTWMQLVRAQPSGNRKSAEGGAHRIWDQMAKLTTAGGLVVPGTTRSKHIFSETGWSWRWTPWQPPCLRTHY
jgi:hypothetical protein